MKERKIKRVIIASSFPKRECGLAVYNTDLVNSLKKNHLENLVFIAINEGPGKGIFEPWVKEHLGFEINQLDPESTRAAAKFINGIYQPGDVFVGQHEFGLWAPHHEQDCAVDFTRILKEGGVPTAYIFHTLFPEGFDDPQKDGVIRGLQKNIDLGISLTPTGLNLLIQKYGFMRGQCEEIPHGVPDTVFTESKRELKMEMGLAKKSGVERRVVTTVGFLGRGKCLEDGITGFTIFRNKDPTNNPIYIIEGETPPPAYCHEGNSYVYECVDLASRLGNKVMLLCNGEYEEAKERFRRTDNVQVKKFNEAKNKMKNSNYLNDINILFKLGYLETNDLLRNVERGDVSLVTNGDPKQYCSGQIFWYTSRGRVVIATESPCAKDFDKKDMGLLVKFNNPGDVASKLEHFYNNPDLMNEKARNARKSRDDNAWSYVGYKTLDSLDTIVRN